jgi:hypothetical protein
MSTKVLPGLVRHLKTGKLYSVLGTARHVDNPELMSVVYLQNYESILRGTDEKLPMSTMWIREVSDFQKKFEQIRSRE